MFSFVRDMATDRPARFADLYEYFSGSMAADAGVGGVRRRWLETESALSKANSAEEREVLSSVAVLGFGTSGERVRVKKELLEFAISGPGGLSRARAGKTIEVLVGRKLLLYRERNDEISVWHGTDIDIRGHLREEILKVESEFNTVEVLSREYPAPNWRPVGHNVKNSIRRFFSGEYVSAGELLRAGLKHPLLTLGRGEDGRVVYCIAETTEEVSRLVSFAGSMSSLNPGIIFTVPRKPVSILGVALEIAALERMRKDPEIIASDPFVLPELCLMADFAREDLARAMGRVVHPGPDGAMWFSGGREISVDDDRRLREKLSEITDGRFPLTPKINNELVVRGRLSRPMVNARKKLILGILERSGWPHLGFKREATTPDIAMYRTVLERAGLYVSSDKEGRWAEPDGLQDGGLTKVWGILREFFGEPGRDKSPEKELFDRLESPPHGMRKGLLPILVAAGLQAFARAVVIRRLGSYLPDVLASEIEEFCSSPEKFVVDVLEVNRDLSLYLEKLIELFDGRRPVAGGDLIRQFHDALEFWKAQLPEQALRTGYVSDGARSFQAILRKSEDPAVIALEEFPRLADADGPDSGTLKLVTKLVCEIEGIVEGYAAKAISVTSEIFGAGRGEGPSLLEQARNWAMCFDEETMNLSEIDTTSRAVLVRAREATEDRYTEASFVRALSSILLGKGFDKWDDSSPREFADGIRETVAKLERISLEADVLPDSVMPLLDRHFHRFYGHLERMLGPDEAAGKIKDLLEERKKSCLSLKGESKSNGAYERSA